MSAFALASELPVCSYRIKAEGEGERARDGSGGRALSALAMLTCAAEPGGWERNPQPSAVAETQCLGRISNAPLD